MYGMNFCENRNALILMNTEKRKLNPIPTRSLVATSLINRPSLINKPRRLIQCHVLQRYKLHPESLKKQRTNKSYHSFLQNVGNHKFFFIIVVVYHSNNSNDFRE